MLPLRRLVPGTSRWTPGRTQGRHKPPGGQHRCLSEVLPLSGLGRHGGIGYELVLSSAVTQGYQEAETTLPAFLKREREKEEAREREKVMNRKVTVQEIPEVQGGAPSRVAIPQERTSEQLGGAPGYSSEANFGANSEADRRCSRADYSSDANFGANSGADRRSRAAKYSSEANFQAYCGAERR